MNCPNNCGNKARVDPIYGVLPCIPCSNKPHQFPHQQIEFTTDHIKEERKEFSDDIRPAHRKGQLDKGFVERYGVKKALQQGFSRKEIKNAKHVWAMDDYYKNV